MYSMYDVYFIINVGGEIRYKEICVTTSALNRRDAVMSATINLTLRYKDDEDFINRIVGIKRVETID